MRLYLVFFIAFLPFSALAEIENLAIPNHEGLALYSWPKVSAPEGWHQDTPQSYYYRSNAFAPDGKTFRNSEVVMYARAESKAKLAEIKTFEDFIEKDKKDFLTSDSNVEIQEAKSLLTADSKSLTSFFFKSGKSIERVSYGEEGEFYIIFTISSRDETAYKLNETAYIEMIENYK